MLCASTADLTRESAARAHADAIEFRLDLAERPVEQLSAYDGELPLVVTNRADWEGGEADSIGRYETLVDAVKIGAVEAVDIELAALRGNAPAGEQAHATALRETARKEGATVIASVHDFDVTPEVDVLVALLADAAAEGDIAKLATMAVTRADALAMLQATHTATSAGHAVATMCMGEPGRHTRAVTPLYGSRIGYAPIDPANATAPGQIELATLRSLVSDLSTDVGTEIVEEVE